ncbi:MAG: tRNA threonylcarbamoyladenosine dehydratase [Bacteroidia bacterium]|nr:tRNA threonylcarbamoyladenosine dehydratase [Bacteroidia bacterium]MCF8445995.1 tRNA threonylcarbamoyladenosine dehydratase [Bacteroidia bacterium]
MSFDIQPWMGRTELLLGQNQLHKLINSNVLVVGLGGVGGIAAEMIARSGVMQMTIVDADTVDATNRNRQIPALKSTEGKVKADVLAERLLDINPDLQLQVIPEYFRDQLTFDVLDNNKFDYALDCIDTLSPKVYYIKACIDRGIPIISSMGAGSKVDPTMVKVADISETYNCHLARYTRKYLHRLGVYKGVKAVFSSEQKYTNAQLMLMEARNKKSAPGTISYMPTVFGCTVASVAIRDLCNR